MTDIRAESFDEADAEEEEPLLCTYAATGSRMSFQAVYNCQTCMNSFQNKSDDEASDLCCICDSCAACCHEDHDVNFLGYAPAYCDCGKNGSCRILEESSKIALKVGVPEGGKSTETFHSKVLEDNSCGICNPFGYVVKSYNIGNDFNESDLCKEMLRQAEVVASFEKNESGVNRTFWVSSNQKIHEDLCDLEMIALQFFRCHVKAFNMEVTEFSGAEWWVQVKQKSQDDSENYNPVDLHYDKDEAMASKFGLGFFPSLSTVTYLTSNAFANPTVIFPQTYHDSQGTKMSQVIISRSEKGKHIVFDGRLLHGAPRLNLFPTLETSSHASDDIRVTFLVNIWLHGKPLDAKTLSISERQCLLNDRLCYCTNDSYRSLYMNEQPIPSHTIDEISSDKNDRVLLPFISTEAEWIDDEVDNDIRVSMIMPPTTIIDSTFMAMFGRSFEAIFTGIEEESMDDDLV